MFPPGLAVGLGIGALAEVAKKSIRHNGAAGNSRVMYVNRTVNRPCGGSPGWIKVPPQRWEVLSCLVVAAAGGRSSY